MTRIADTDTLIPGQKYNVEDVIRRFMGWAKEGSTIGSHLHGYSVPDYFDAEGRYLGEDTEGIEPLLWSEEFARTIGKGEPEEDEE